MLRKTLDILSPRERKQGFALLGLMLVSALLELAGVGVFYPFLALIADPAAQASNPFMAWLRSASGIADSSHFLVAVGAVVLGVILLTNAAIAFTIFCQMKYVWGVNHALSERLLERYLAQPYTWFLHQNTSRLSKNVLEDAHKVTSGTLDPMLTLASRLMAALAVVSLLLVVEPVVTLVAVIVLGGGYTAIYLGLRRTAGARGRKWAKANAKRYHVVSEILGGVKDIKVMGLEPVMVRRFEPSSRKYTHNYAIATIIKRIPTYIVQTLAFAGITGLLLALILSGRDMKAIITVVGVFAFAGLRLMPIFQQILTAFVTFRVSDHVVSLIRDDLRQLAPAPGIHGDPLSIDPLPLHAQLELAGVTFQYAGGERPAVRGLSVTIPARSSVAFVGHTGAGKTTVADIILGLLVPQEGQILIDGESLTASRMRRWRRNIGYVPQTIYLSDDTLARNIAFGMPIELIDMDAVHRAASVAHIHEFITEQTPRGYETEVGERGVRLSGGQRQRIGIARALYRDPDVLVLDEATSDIDTETEAHITRAIDDLAGAKTLIVIAHRFTTIRKCDRIYLLEAGHLTAAGSYSELINEDARFQRLAQEVVSRPSAT